MTNLIDSRRRGVAIRLEQIAQLGRTLARRHADILASFDHHASNRLADAIDDRPEALRRNALGFRYLTHRRSAQHSTAARCSNSLMHSELRRARLRKYGGAQRI